jgi:hypothetical protein
MFVCAYVRMMYMCTWDTDGWCVAMYVCMYVCIGQGVNALGKYLQQGEGRQGGLQFMIICKNSDATGPRNLNQSQRQAIVGFEFKKGVSDLHDLRLRGPWKCATLTRTRAEEQG